MIAVIPAKYDSKRVKNKNIIPFYKNKSLLELKIKQLQSIDAIKEIYVNSESDKILDIVEKLGAKSIKRIAYYSKDYTPIEEVYKHIVNNIPGYDYEGIIYTLVTSPLIKNETYEDAIKLYEEDEKNIVSFSLLRDYIWDDNGPINYEVDNQIRSQNLKPYYKMTSNFFIFNKYNVKYDGVLVKKNCYKYIVDYPECLDIDDMEDFKIAQMIYGSRYK